MTTYFVGPGGNNANSGLTYALRKLTINGAEDVPVAAGDTVIIAPGIYHETVTIDVSGESGSPITYTGDVTGRLTDGVGGVVFISGADSPYQTFARSAVVSGTSKNYRTFNNIVFDGTTGNSVLIANGTNWTVNDCVFMPQAVLLANGASQAAHAVNRCVFYGHIANNSVKFTHTSTVDNAGHTVTNCLFLGGNNHVVAQRVGGIVINGCTHLFNRGQAIQIETALTAGQTVTVNNCIIAHGVKGLSATAVGEIVEDYNNVYNNATDRQNVTAGANSVAYIPGFNPSLLLAGYNIHESMYSLSPQSPLRAIAGTSMPAADLRGMTRPATDSKKSWGTYQFVDASRSETQRTGATGASLKLADAGRIQLRVPVTAVSTTFTVKVWREADYAGTLPQMIVKQDGVADSVTTDTGAAAGWNTVTVTLTPAALPGWVVVELVSNNTATADDYNVYFEDFQVT
jgi:hypothetical protein